MSKVFDKDALDNLFNVNRDANVIPTEDGVAGQALIVTEVPASTIENIEECESENEKLVNDQLRLFLADARCIMDNTKVLVENSPDAETIQSAAALLTSITNLVAELNKGILLNKKHKYQMKVEKIRSRAREQLMAIREKQLALGSGNTFVQNNMKLIPFSQEDIVNKIINRRT